MPEAVRRFGGSLVNPEDLAAAAAGAGEPAPLLGLDAERRGSAAPRQR